MAFDACMLHAVLNEFSREFPEAKIEKVLQPANDEIDLVIHYGRVSRRLLFNVGPNAPRIQLTDIAKENPKVAPPFCMFLRKRLIGAKIVSVAQPHFDRIARLTVIGYDDMGYPLTMYIVCEIMGKYANFILLDSDEKIISALKPVDFAASSVRQILAGLRYEYPAISERQNPLDVRRHLFDFAYDAFDKTRTVEKFITSTYSGVAIQIARELAYRACGRLDALLLEIDKERLYAVLREWGELLTSHSYEPTVAIDKEGAPRDYSYMKISYLGEGYKYLTYKSIRELFDVYFAEKDRLEKLAQRARDVRTLLSTATARIQRKLALQRQTLLDSERGEEYRRQGDLITANLFRIPRGAESVCVVDYYDESCPTVEIKLDKRLSATANAQRLYKQYNKAKTARRVLAEQIELWEGELRYLESVSAFLEAAESEADIADIRDELYASGYGSRMRGYKPRPNTKPRPIVMTTSGGFTLLVGRNNVENDRLTLKVARKEDLWFHAKDYPGSHVILVTEGREPSDTDYTEACQIAAGYSKASSQTVAVDYTRVKNIKKPQGARAGFVTYKTNYTAFVRPRKTLDGDT